MKMKQRLFMSEDHVGLRNRLRTVVKFLVFMTAISLGTDGGRYDAGG